MSNSAIPFGGVSESGAGISLVACPSPKNREGQLGPICRKCDGWGFLLGIKASGNCAECSGTGVAKNAFADPMVRAYLDQVNREIRALEERVARLDPGLRQSLAMEDLLNLKMSRQYFMETIWWATSSGTAVANTVTETIIFPNVTIPGNYMQDGRALRLRVQGQHSTLGSGTVTLTFRLRWGGVSGTVMALTGAITQVISLTAAAWDLDILVQTRSNGSSGTVMAIGTARVFGATAPTIGSATGAPAIAPMTQGGQTTPAVATLDLTADTALAISVQHGAASSSNTLTGLNYVGESLN